jgi:hypothetical protein
MPIAAATATLKSQPMAPPAAVAAALKGRRGGWRLIEGCSEECLPLPSEKIGKERCCLWERGVFVTCTKGKEKAIQGKGRFRHRFRVGVVGASGTGEQEFKDTGPDVGIDNSVPRINAQRSEPCLCRGAALTASGRAAVHERLGASLQAEGMNEDADRAAFSRRGEGEQRRGESRAELRGSGHCKEWCAQVEVQLLTQKLGCALELRTRGRDRAAVRA